MQVGVTASLKAIHNMVELRRKQVRQMPTTKQQDVDQSARSTSIAPAEISQSVEYEFGGPVGALATMICLPIVVIVLGVACGDKFCLGIDSGFGLGNELMSASFWSVKAIAVIAGWIGFQAVLHVILPGATAQGSPIKGTGPRLDYKLNGHLAFWVSLLVVGLGSANSDRLSFVYDNFIELAVASCTLSLILGIGLYAASFRRPEPVLANPGSTGVAVYDCFMGRELNPRIGSFDLKYFCELRPGLIGWLVLNLGCCAKRKQLRGAIGLPLSLVTLFQGIYVWDALCFEKAILTTMDITTDGFGVMLAFGDLAWVPFTYSLQSRFLVQNDPDLPTWAIVTIVLLHSVGYFVFRGANWQKDIFRSDFQVAEKLGMRWMQTAHGKKLLISGFWGAARKINYFGDWLISLSWCLLTGFKSPIPYFYCTYFAVLLVHRAMRDDHACARKYGDDWSVYKQQVPYLFVPGLF